MATAGIRVLTIGKQFNLPLWPQGYHVRHLERIQDLQGTIADFRPDVIVTGNYMPGSLKQACFNLRRKWIHPDAAASPQDVERAIESCYFTNIWNEPKNPFEKDHPLVTVYTPSYNTGDFLRETYQSLKEQTYSNWEWVVVDDYSSDQTWDRLQQIAKEDIRVRVFRSGRSSGKIGEMKDHCTRLARGKYLVELDADDMLTDFALQEIVTAFESDHEIGMVYSNCANFYQDGTWHKFESEWWQKYYRWTEYRGKQWLECRNPDIYDRFGPKHYQQFGWFLTVGPNHVRCYRAETLRELGGYNPEIPVADDWDVYARFFVHSKCHHIDKMLYLYRFLDAWTNTTFTRNKSIQDHLALGQRHYNNEFDAFNMQRLHPDGRKGDKEETLLTVVVPAIPRRMKHGLMTVMDMLLTQSEGKPVEIMCLLDNFARNLSEKRNMAVKNAKGRFISFVDDDDLIEPDYIDEILKAIRENPKADCVVFDVLVHGYTPEPKISQYDKDFEDKPYKRKPNHVMVWRRDVIRNHPWRVNYSAVAEDTEWPWRAAADINEQVRIPKVLYHYQFDPKETTQLIDKGTQCPPMAEKGVPGEPGVRAMGTADVSYVVLEAVPDILTQQCLQSIRDNSPGSEVILVANGCEPMLAASALADKVIRLEENTGFAAGCNAGFEAISRPLVCFMNNDAAFVDDTPQKLVDAMGPVDAIVAPYSNAAKPPQGDISRENCPSEDKYPGMVVGLCAMMPADVYRKVGGYDPRLLTYEDDALCRKAALMGYRSKVVGGTWVQHERHATFNALGLDPQKVMKKNEKIYQRMNPRIAVIAISKDEEKCIKDFFHQFATVTRDWFLFDTGSQDQTVRIATEAGVRVKIGNFTDFAAARNKALNQFSKGFDWIIMLDPDERLDKHTIDSIRETVYRTEYDIFLAPLDAVNADGSRKEFVPKPFLFRNKPDIEWVNKVHEKLIGSKRQALVKNAKIDHLVPLHEDGRRVRMADFYQSLQDQEPFYTDPEYKKSMHKKWPILEYGKHDDDRIDKVIMGPLISVVIPTFKRRALLESAVLSALQQDYVNLDIVVVGDDCPDLKDDPMMFTNHPTVRVHNMLKNHGAGGAAPRNHALRIAAGDLIAYLDDDNAWKPNHVSSLYELYRKAGGSFVFSSMSVEGKDLKFTEPKFQGIDTSCVLHEKALVRKYGEWKDRVEGGYAHDWEFFERWVKGEEKWACTKLPTLIYNADSSGQKEFLLSKAGS